jgi:hypothetical protein
MSDPAFGTTPIFSSEDPFELAVSPDGLAFTITFSDFEAHVDSGSPAPIAMRVKSFVLPIEGSGDGVTVAVRTSGFAFVTDGAAGSAVVVVNGNVGAERAAPGADNSFVHEVVAEGIDTAECRISVILVAERDFGNPDAVAHLSVPSIDAEISRSTGGTAANG